MGGLRFYGGKGGDFARGHFARADFVEGDFMGGMAGNFIGG